LSLGRCANWIWGFEDDLEFFEGTSDSLDAKEVPNNGFDNIPSDKDKDVFVSNVVEGDGSAVQVDEGEDADNNTVHTHTLGTSLGSQAFYGVEGLERSVGEGIDDVEEEVGSECSLTNLEVSDAVCSVRVPLGAQSTIDCQHDGADKSTDNEDLAAGHAVSEGYTAQCTNARGDRVAKVKNELHVGVIAERLVDGQVEVSETVSRELTEHTHKNDHEEAPACLVGLEKSRVIPPALIRRVEFDSFLELNPLEFDDWVVFFTISMVLGQEGLGFGVTTVGDEPTRRLGQEPDDEDDDTSRNALEDERKAPLEIAIDLLCSEGDGSSGDGTSEPTAVVEGGKATAAAATLEDGR